MEQGLEWRIFPTSVIEAVIPDPLVASRSPNRNARANTDEPVSRDELLHDLLLDQQKEIHVEDFLWTGSGEEGRSFFIALLGLKMAGKHAKKAKRSNIGS